jgi:hypothetical protein
LALCIAGECAADFGARHQGQCDDGERDQNLNQGEAFLSLIGSVALALVLALWLFALLMSRGSAWRHGIT